LVMGCHARDAWFCAGYLFGESCGLDAANFGLRVGVVYKSADAVTGLQAIADLMTESKKETNHKFDAFREEFAAQA
jgi:hypothetical protein